jgi:transcriptional regulator with XRE-family HTH domain
MDPEGVGKRIRRLRLERGLSLRDLEELARVSRTTISAYERGKMRMSLEALSAIARALEVPLSLLLGEEGEAEPSPSLSLEAAFFKKLSALSPRGRKSVLSYLDFLLSKERKRREGKKE